MKRESVYLDTSVPSAYYDKRAKERQEATIKVWEEILPCYTVYISEIVTEELNNTKDVNLTSQLSKLVEGFEVLRINESIKELADLYIDKNIFPFKYKDDALHVAIASFNAINYLLSWNFEHMVKVKTRKFVNFINVINGYREIEIISPQEL